MAMVLRRMDQLKPIMSGAIKGTLTQSNFTNAIVIAKMFWSIVAISKNILPNAARNIALADFVARLNCAAPPAKHNIL